MKPINYKKLTQFVGTLVCRPKHRAVGYYANNNEIVVAYDDKKDLYYLASSEKCLLWQGDAVHYLLGRDVIIGYASTSRKVYRLIVNQAEFTPVIMRGYISAKDRMLIAGARMIYIEKHLRDEVEITTTREYEVALSENKVKFV